MHRCYHSNLVLQSIVFFLCTKKKGFRPLLFFIINKTCSMDKLPKEILIQITSILSFSDKHKCMLVCKLWYYTLIETHLYSELKFKQPNTLQQAMRAFKNSHQSSKQVTTLVLTGLNLKPCLERLLMLFPNLKHLSWIDDYTLPTKYLVKPTWKTTWYRLQQIEESVISFSITHYLLIMQPMHCLKRINICFRGIGYDCDALCIGLVQHLHHAPALEQLTLSSALIGVRDMEIIHRGSTQLKVIVLINIKSPSWEPRITVTKTAHLLEFFKFHYSPETRNDKIIDTWINYFSQKYINAHKIKIVNTNMRYKLYSGNQQANLEQSIIDLFTNLPNLTSYEINASPITERMMAILGRRKIRLKQLQLWIETDEQLERESKIVGNSNQVESIETLIVTQWRRNGQDNTSLLPKILIELCSSMKNLVSLTIENTIKAGVNVLIAILQSLVHLETLSVDLIEFKNGIDHRLILDKALMKQCKIKNLHIHVGYSSKRHSLMLQVNESFQYVLQSCPNLEKVSISGILYGQNSHVFTLDFMHHYRLKYIYIHVHGCAYYILNDEKVRWKSYRVISTETEESPKFHMHLYHRSNVNLKLMRV